MIKKINKHLQNLHHTSFNHETNRWCFMELPFCTVEPSRAMNHHKSNGFAAVMPLETPQKCICTQMARYEFWTPITTMTAFMFVALKHLAAKPRHKCIWACWKHQKCVFIPMKNVCSSLKGKHFLWVALSAVESLCPNQFGILEVWQRHLAKNQIWKCNLPISGSSYWNQKIYFYSKVIKNFYIDWIGTTKWNLNGFFCY